MEVRYVAIEAGRYALYAGVGFLLGLTNGSPLLINGAAGAITTVAYRALSNLVNFLSETHDWNLSSMLFFKSIGLALVISTQTITLLALSVLAEPQAIANLVVGLMVPLSGIGYALYLKLQEGDLSYLAATRSQNFAHRIVLA